MFLDLKKFEHFKDKKEKTRKKESCDVHYCRMIDLASSFVSDAFLQFSSLDMSSKSRAGTKLQKQLMMETEGVLAEGVNLEEKAARQGFHTFTVIDLGDGRRFDENYKLLL